MPQVAVRLILAAVLLAAAVLKLADRRGGPSSLATFGVRSARAQRVVWPVSIAAEVVLAGGVAAGLDLAAYLAAALMAAYTAALAGALRAGRAGQPCGCFGARSRVGRGALARSAVLGAGFAVIPAIPEGHMSTDAWLAVGLGVALAAIAGLAVAVLALAREVGVLRLSLAPQVALEIPEEGPELGGRSSLIERVDVGSAHLAVAVFTSEGCRVCAALEPALEALARDPVLSLTIFDEVRDADVWRVLDIPGSPFAVALDRDGVVLAKGTFNSLPQLEGLLAAAERRAKAASW